jgi:hypothetical protein
MPGAGFYEIRSSTIRFGRDGVWYADGEPIPNPRITALFSRHLVRQDDGSYRIEIGFDRAPVEIEDTPYVVQRVDGDPEHGFRVELNDGSREPLAAETLAISADHVLYCRVKDGGERARFLRPAYYQLSSHFEEGAPGRFVLRSRGQSYSIDTA